MFRLNSNENILAVYHRHWLILFWNLFIIGIVGIFMVIMIFILKKYVPAMSSYPFNRILNWLIIVFLQGVWVTAFIKITDYWLDTWILTNERIIDIVQKGLFRREIAEFKLNKIQDVAFDIKGIIPTLFRFGDVRIQTAGFERNFTFLTVPHPQEIKNTILKAYDEYIETEKAEAQAFQSKTSEGV